MKKNFILIFFIFLTSCTAEKEISKVEICPKVMFAKEHQTYIDSNEKVISFENLSYVAKLNNYSFLGNCLSYQDIIEINLSLLFIINSENIPINEIILPYYIATLNSKDEVLDIQYYLVKRSIKDIDAKNLSELELIDDIKISTLNKDKLSNSKNYLLIGFMLENSKLNFLN